MRFLSFLTLLLPAFAASYNISTIAGSDWVGENIPATSAILLQAEGITADNAGNLYISDASNHRVRCIAPNGYIRTVAGNGTAGFAGDNGPATSAQLDGPTDIALDTNEGEPGPILLQGDRGPVAFRKIVVYPLIKRP